MLFVEFHHLRNSLRFRFQWVGLSRQKSESICDHKENRQYGAVQMRHLAFGKAWNRCVLLAMYVFGRSRKPKEDRRSSMQLAGSVLNSLVDDIDAKLIGDVAAEMTSSLTL